MSINVKLVVVGGDVKTTELTLRLPSTIGRGRGTSVVLPHPLVSRQHCELFEADGQLMVRDLGSLNGTFVNNQRVTESPLPPGELLTIGTVTFRAVYESLEAAHSVTPASKSAAGDKTIPASKAPTIKAAAKESPAAHSDSEVLEFNFDQSLVDAEDESDEPGASTYPTERLTEPTPQVKPEKPQPEDRPREKSAKSASKSNQPSPNQSSPDDVTIRSDEADIEPSNSDDDLNDFLKSLGDDSA